MTDANKLIGVVLAGGRSSRMGRDKAQLDWHGVSLLDRMCRILLDAGVARVVVSGDRPGHDCVPDVEPERGPGFAVSGVLATLPADATALVVPVDMPLLTPALLRMLTAHRAACFEGHPLPALLPTRAADGGELRADSIKGLHRAAGSVALPVTADAAAILVNANTPEEWLRLSTETAT